MAKDLIPITKAAYTLQKGDRIGRKDGPRVRYATWSDSGRAVLVYVEGEKHPWRYGEHEAITAYVPRQPLRGRRLGSRHEAYGFDIEISEWGTHYCYTVSTWYGTPLSKKCGFKTKKAALTAGKKAAKGG
jgi:hypothetical protein